MIGILYSNLALQDARAGKTEEGIAGFKKALASHRVAGDEEALAFTYSQLGQTFLTAGLTREAERCLNNASEHFIKLGNEAGEASALRLLADLYERVGDRESAIRCLERVVSTDRRYSLPQGPGDEARLSGLRERRPKRNSRDRV